MVAEDTCKGGFWRILQLFNQLSLTLYAPNASLFLAADGAGFLEDFLRFPMAVSFLTQFPSAEILESHSQTGDSVENLKKRDHVINT